jgi:hypothetical protein
MYPSHIYIDCIENKSVPFRYLAGKKPERVGVWIKAKI